MTAAEVLSRLAEHAHQLPASAETRSRLAGSDRHFWRNRKLTELAALCLLNESLRHPRWGNGMYAAKHEPRPLHNAKGRPLVGVFEDSQLHAQMRAKLLQIYEERA